MAADVKTAANLYQPVPSCQEKTMYASIELQPSEEMVWKGTKVSKQYSPFQTQMNKKLILIKN